MRSALKAKLSPEEHQKLLDYVIERRRQLKDEMEGSTWWMEREKFERVAASDFSHRLSGKPDGQTIFDRENNSLQIVRSVRRFLHARLSKDLFGSAPWFATKPQGPLDSVTADQIQKHGAWKLDQAQYKAKAKEALGLALDLGECPIKTAWKVEDDVHERFAMIVCDAKGKPVLTEDGDYLYEDDETVEAGGEEMGPMGDMGQMGPMEEPEEGAGTVSVFARAPEIPVPGPGNEYQWKEHLIEETERLYQGLHMAPLNWRDVFYPLNVACIQEADMVGHDRDMTPDEINTWLNPDGDNKEVEAMVELLRGASSHPKANASLPKPEQGESRTFTRDEETAVIRVTEVYFRRVINGRLTRIWAVFVGEDCECGKTLLWFDYLAAVSPRSKYPIHLLAVNRVPGRAYGRGLYKVYELAAEAIDKLINGILYRNSYNSDPIKIFNSQLVEGGQVDKNLRLGPGALLKTTQRQIKADEVLQFIEIPDLDTRTWQLVELFVQLIQVESGVTQATQGDLSNLPSNGTATGVNSLLESSSVLHFFILEEARDGFTPQLCYAIELIYFFQDQDETYEYLEGQAAGVLALSDAKALSKLPMNVEILLSRAKRQEMREAAFAAIPYGEKFWQLVVMNPLAAKKLRPLYIQAFRGLEIDNADTFFPTEEEIDQMVAAMQQQAAASAVPTEAEQAPSEEAPVEAVPALPSNVIPAAITADNSQVA